MPIIAKTTNLPGPNAAAEWTYVPGEQLDFSRFTHISCLYVRAVRPIPSYIPTYIRNLFTSTPVDEEQPTPYTLPSLATLFPNLAYLRISNVLSNMCFIGALTDIPETVFDVIIESTYITDLTPLFRHGINLLSVAILNNYTPVSISIPVTHGIRRFFMESTVVDTPIIFPKTIMSITCVRCNIPRIEGLEHAESNLYLCIEECITPYDQSSMWCVDTQPKIAHITHVNAQRVYLELGSIPRRIKVSNEDDVKNPIVVAMNLSSNYPRRMSEFIAITQVETVFVQLQEDNADDADNLEIQQDEPDWYDYGDDDEDYY